MVPDLEAMGIRMLLNECEAIERGGATIYLAGIDDAHFYRVDNIDGSCIVRTEDSLCNNGRAIRQRKQDQNLCERYIVHAPTVPKTE
jgi:hypothetical protein